MPQTPLNRPLTHGSRRHWSCLVAAVCLALCPMVSADEVRVAVAANFAHALKSLAADFERTSGHKVLMSAGATGKLYAQIKNDAPFHVLLAADTETPVKLEREGAAVAGSRFTYAVGKLALWSARAGFVDAQGEILKTGNFKHLAVATPSLAPYGAAAVQTLDRLGLLNALTPRLVQGESIGQTYAFVATGNAELGFVALSQVFEFGRISKGSLWIVPDSLHSPLRQDAVLLIRGRDQPAARALLAFLKTQQSKAVIRSFGYETE